MQAASYFGTGLANLLNILHPERVILGGPLIVSNDLFFECAIEVARKKTYYYPKYQVKFTKSRLGADAVCIGAAVQVLNRMENT
jgi:predicted NBD/HSP70 family sugar kinase